MTVEWPPDWERTPASHRERTSKFSASRGDTTSELATEMGRIGADTWRASTGSGSSHTKSNGLPKYSANPDDPGFVLRWTQDGHDHAIACDHYSTLDANMRAVLLYVQDNRHADMRPVLTGQDQFAAARLPSGDGEKPIAVGEGSGMTKQEAAELLGVRADADEDAIKGVAERKLRVDHPDHGGRGEVRRIQKARDVLLEEA